MCDIEILTLFVVDHKQRDIEYVLINEVVSIADTRNWAVGGPRVVVTNDKIYGIELEVYSAIKQKLPRDIDVQCLKDVEAVMNFCCLISKKHKLIFEVDYRNECIGEISKGKLDKSLSNGLIGEWKKALKLECG
jgi:hypothetical protein